MKNIIEPAKELKILAEADVVVCGGGPAGIAAAIAAARKGVRTLLLESAGNLGGVWSSGLMPYILGYCEQYGIISEIKEAFQAVIDESSENSKSLPLPESVKLIVEQMCLKAGVDILLHCKVCGVLKRHDRIRHVIVESPDGRHVIAGKMFIDCTGNGDLGAYADCGFDLGNENGLVQPMSLIGLVTGIDYSKIKTFVSGSEEAYSRLYNEFQKCNISPSYSRTSLFRISDDIYVFMGNHQYNVPCSNTVEITAAILAARKELHALINALRSSGGKWQHIKLIATANQIGIREGRRLHGLYTVKLDDLTSGRTFPDAACKVLFGIDVHAMSIDSSRGLTGISKANPVKLYDIPLRALISRDCDNLLMAGRCISGDFYAHASYRVTGIAVPCGEAAGNCAADSFKLNLLPKSFIISKYFKPKKRSVVCLQKTEVLHSLNCSL